MLVILAGQAVPLILSGRPMVAKEYPEMTGNVIRVRNAGPISLFEALFDQPGGVLVASGHIGSGKTTLIKAVESATTRRGAAKLTVKDGEFDGEVEVFGATVSLGLGTKPGYGGELIVRSLHCDLDPSELVDPGKKDALVNDEHRIVMLCRFAGVDAGLHLFEGVCPKVHEVASQKTAGAVDLPTQAAMLKRDLEELARQEAGKCEQLRTKGRALIDQAGAVPEARPAAEAQAELDVAADRRARLRADKRAAEANKKAIDKARKTLEAVGERPKEDHQKLVEQADLNVAAANLVLQKAAEELGRAQAAHEAATNALQAAARGRQDAHNARTRAELDEDIARKARETLETLKAADAPSEQALLDADEDFQKAKDAVIAAQRAEEAAALRSQGQAFMDEAQAHEDQAKLWRGQGEATEQVIAAAVARIAPEGVSVERGRVFRMTPRGKTLFEDLSTGERWKIAAPAAFKAAGRNSLIGIKQEGWQSLNPEEQMQLAKDALEHGVRVVTAQVADGPLRYEIIP